MTGNLKSSDVKPETKNKKALILDSALTLFVTQGIDATSTASIAKHAGVVNGTLFHHFPSKEALVLSLYTQIKQDFALQITPFIPDPKKLTQQARKVWDQAIDWAIMNADKQQFCLLVTQYQQLSTTIKTQVLTEEFGYLPLLIKYGQEHNLIEHYPLNLMVDNAHSQFICASQYLANNPAFINDITHRDAIFDMFWHAIAKR